MQSLGRKQRIYFMVPKTLSYSSLWGYCGFWGLDFLNINIAGNVPALRGTMSMGNFPPKITLWNQNSSTWLKLKYSCISWNIKVACLNRLFILCRIKCFVEIRRVNLTILCFVISLTLFFIAASFQLSCVLDMFLSQIWHSVNFYTSYFYSIVKSKSACLILYSRVNATRVILLYPIWNLWTSFWSNLYIKVTL